VFVKRDADAGCTHCARIVFQCNADYKEYLSIFDINEFRASNFKEYLSLKQLVFVAILCILSLESPFLSSLLFFIVL
jgi:hypothetical protein